MALLRSVLHALWMFVTVVPWAIIMLVCSIWMRGIPLYWMAARWLSWAVGSGARALLGSRSSRIVRRCRDHAEIARRDRAQTPRGAFRCQHERLAPR